MKQMKLNHNTIAFKTILHDSTATATLDRQNQLAYGGGPLIGLSILIISLSGTTAVHW